MCVWVCVCVSKRQTEKEKPILELYSALQNAQRFQRAIYRAFHRMIQHIKNACAVVVTRRKLFGHSAHVAGPIGSRTGCRSNLPLERATCQMLCRSSHLQSSNYTARIVHSIVQRTISKCKSFRRPLVILFFFNQPTQLTTKEMKLDGIS